MKSKFALGFGLGWIIGWYAIGIYRIIFEKNKLMLYLILYFSF